MTIAVEVLTLLAGRGQFRAPSVPGLISAATAELAGLTVLHFDKDFDLIASVTGQPAQWLTATSPSRRQYQRRHRTTPAVRLLPALPTWSGGADRATAP